MKYRLCILVAIVATFFLSGCVAADPETIDTLETLQEQVPIVANNGRRPADVDEIIGAAVELYSAEIPEPAPPPDGASDEDVAAYDEAVLERDGKIGGMEELLRSYATIQEVLDAVESFLEDALRYERSK